MISVVICTYNRSSSLRRTLESLARMSVPPDLDGELIVVDNNSSDDTRAVIEEFARTSTLNVRYIFEGEQGKSNALNAGVREARGEIIAFTDDDVSVGPEWLVNLKQAFEEFDCMGVAGRVVPVWDGPKPSWIELEGPFKAPGPVVSFDRGNAPRQLREMPTTGANMAFRRGAFDKLGGFRTDLGPVGSNRLNAEDTEFGERLVIAGGKIMYIPSAVIYHPVDPRRATRSYFLSFYFIQGRSCVRYEGWPIDCVRYWGVPRYMFRSLGENFIRWLMSLNRKARFYHKLQLWSAAGAIVEARRLSKS